MNLYKYIHSDFKILRFSFIFNIRIHFLFHLYECIICFCSHSFNILFSFFCYISSFIIKNYKSRNTHYSIKAKKMLNALLVIKGHSKERHVLIIIEELLFIFIFANKENFHFLTILIYIMIKLGQSRSEQSTRSTPNCTKV